MVVPVGERHCAGRDTRGRTRTSRPRRNPRDSKKSRDVFRPTRAPVNAYRASTRVDPGGSWTNQMGRSGACVMHDHGRRGSKAGARSATPARYGRSGRNQYAGCEDAAKTRHPRIPPRRDIRGNRRNTRWVIRVCRRHCQNGLPTAGYYFTIIPSPCGRRLSGDLAGFKVTAEYRKGSGSGAGFGSSTI